MLFSYLKKRAVLRKRVSKLTRNLEKLSDSADLSTRYDVGIAAEELCQLFEQMFGPCGRGICFGQIESSVGENGLREFKLMQALACVFPQKETLPTDVRWETLCPLLSLVDDGSAPFSIRTMCEQAQMEHWSRDEAKFRAAEEREVIRFRKLRERYEQKGY